MKIQCDVCNKQQASLFCTADEAALCDGCDHRVHHANKLASKHQRFSLSHPSAKHFPLCDVCQERRAFVFCQQDRAILCKECDVPVHSANDLTKNHNRFLLTGIKFSALDSPSTPPKPAGGNSLTNQQPQQQTGFTGSSISEYLINTIPGMEFEDFLDSHSLPFACSKNSDDMMLSMFGEGNMVSFSAGGIWVPQAPSSVQMDQQSGYKDTWETSIRSSFGDDSLLVPQMTPPSNVFNNKRSRLLW
ncbi:hypothetical protein AAZX31_06G025200 [Glycine max]|uniref:B box-type domain-containing protein n=2 Tax=Glycine subgen. Soja TaxID=1462606 RepID=A0A0R4J3G1_SOYBN|nr:B-box zinc finger protein 21 [Glycine max]XP_028234730.1 B-box zinc finger protein 21-like [Glycine soja]KAG5018244.1 hypothetical protein JHK87_014099 [Glycine soja]KAG5030583.1 hypothetical protein JHK85_014565 [Glycine max]KAG5044814.1 hypothetical protein JHK86_014220 [Glycine max]KAG5147310.1 hypothetical protein JHK82_014191 [Glycine max]KAH1123887.1 hypothetical protein GYH30_013894 [Glycine max]|eukprot:XP_003527799.1 B-box zinc finger protein 21 [Glycine max]